MQCGQRVRTIKCEPQATDWTAAALLSRKWGVEGTVVKEHNSHGLTFEVEHEDGSIGHYEEHELEEAT